MDNIFFLKGHVYHARTETAENKFRYPIFNIYFSINSVNQLAALFKNRYSNILKLSSENYLDSQKGNLKEFIQKTVSEKFNFNSETDYDSIFLQTIPKMFGYVFNPVSFWYFFKNKQLVAVLSEVNNTFGERHYYWLEDKKLNLNNQWLRAEKEFHVSPFFDLEGTYQFKFRFDDNKIEAHIQFIGNDEQPRIITWIKGELFHPEDVKLSELIFKYGWMTPLVVVRIHYQALKLYFKKAKFFTKPQLPKNEVTHGSRIDRR